MKKFAQILLVSILGVFLAAGNATALNLEYFTGNSDDNVYNDTGAEYVYLTDQTDPASAPMIELSSTILDEYNQDYIIGIFESDASQTNVVADLAILDTYLDVTTSNVVFDLDLGTVTSEIDTESMGTVFGFYLQFYSDIDGGSLSNEIYYSDASLNDNSDGFSIFYDPNGIKSLGFAELGLGIRSPTSEGLALLSVADVEPVPEPSTILLLGFGLLGLVGFKMKKNKK